MSNWLVQDQSDSVQLGNFDAIVCSNFFKLESIATLNFAGPVIVYHHENQFAYPNRKYDERDFNYTLDEMNNLALSKRHVFNSQWNLDSCKMGYQAARRRIPARFRRHYNDDWIECAEVIYPGADFSSLQGSAEQTTEPVLLWNHRFEHDKRPTVMINIAKALLNKGHKLKLALTGSVAKEYRDIYSDFVSEFAPHLQYYGYVESQDEYFKIIRSSQIAISTTEHEFFGISMMEAYMAGLTLIVPDRFSYPELYRGKDKVMFYDTDENILAAIENALNQNCKTTSRPNAEIYDFKASYNRLDAYVAKWLKT